MDTILKEQYSSIGDLLSADSNEISKLIHEGKITSEDLVEIIDRSMIDLDKTLEPFGSLAQLDSSWLFPFAITTATETHTIDMAIYKLMRLAEEGHPDIVYDKLVTFFHIAINMGMAAYKELEFYKKPLIPPDPTKGDKNV